MKIAVVGFYGFNNFGDEMNLLEMVKLIKRQYPLADITVYSPTLWHTFMQPSYKLVGAGTMDQLRKALNSYDLVILGGGGLIYLGANYFDFLAEGITTPYIFSRVGVDDRAISKEACSQLQDVLMGAADVTVRTNGDRRLLARHLNITCDVVPEAIWNYRAGRIILPGVGKKILICLNTYSAEFTHSIRKSLGRLNPPAAECTISMQDTSVDSYYNIEATNHEHRQVIPDSIGLEGKGACLAAGDLVITSRLHAALVSISHGVPAIMLKSTPKIKFLAEELQLNDWYCSEGVSVELVEKMLCEKKLRRQYLIDVTNEMRNKASSNIIP